MREQTQMNTQQLFLNSNYNNSLLPGSLNVSVASEASNLVPSRSNSIGFSTNNPKECNVLYTLSLQYLT